MAKYLSPGSYFVEVDVSEYPPTVNSSVVGIVGFASKGPVAGRNGDTATLITSQENLIRTFGEPDEDLAGQGLEGALEVLEATNQVYFIRCAESTATEANATVSAGYCPAIQVSSSPLGVSIGTDDATTSSYRFVVTAYDNARSEIASQTFSVPSGTVNAAANGGSTMTALSKVFGGSLDADKVGAFGTTTDGSSFVIGNAAGSGATLEMTMEVYAGYGGGGLTGETAEGWIGVSGLRPLDFDGDPMPTWDAVNTDMGASGLSSVTASGGTFTNLGYRTRSLYPGAGYNEGTTPGGATSGNSVEVDVNGGNNVVVQVNDRGTANETFIGGTTSSVFLEDVIGKTVATKTSDTIIGFYTSAAGNAPVEGITSLDNIYDDISNIGDYAVNTMTGVDGSGGTFTAGDPRFVKLIQGTYSLADGGNGVPGDSADKETELIGAVQSDGGRTGTEALDEDSVPCKMAMIPGFSELDGAQNALITKAESTQKFLAVVSPPYAVGKVQDAIDWTNGRGSDRAAALNSSYAACYWPWLKVFQVFDGKDRWLAPEIYGIRQMCVTDGVAKPWFAPAGLARGRLTKPVDVEVQLNQGDRDSLYSGGNIINPITKFDQDGIVIFGQRTTQRKASALDRINIRRLMIDLRDVIVTATRAFAFEPNDRFTWERVVSVVDPLLDDIRRDRGITEFRVVCDETTNTPLRVDRNELWCKVLLKPTKTAEIVIFEVNITNQSAKIGL